MAHYSEEGAVPIPRDRLWSFLALHADPNSIGRIHPEVVGQRVVSSSPHEMLLERTLRGSRGRRAVSMWKVTTQPPDLFRWEIVAGEVPMAVGSYVENRYADAPGGTTWVRTEAEITIARLPGFLQKSVVRRVLNSIDAQDIAYLKAHP